MQKIIASYLVQKKECSLPGLGHFKISTKPAEHNSANKQLLPPVHEIIFREEEVHLRKDLVTYVSHHQQVHDNAAAENISKWCEITKEKLLAGESIYLQSLGTLQKNSEGNIVFNTKIETRLFDAVRAERVIHKNEEHVVLVGDRETTSAAMNDFYKTPAEIEKKSSWKIWAIIFFITALFILIIHFSGNPFTTPGLGNQIHLSSPAEPNGSYEVK